MKNISKNLKNVASSLILFTGLSVNTLATELPKAAVISCDIKSSTISSEQATSLLRMEFEKTQLFEMSDRYEVTNTLKAGPDLKQEECFSKTCLVNAGNALKVDFAITSTVESYKNFINVNLRIINVKESRIEKNYTADFINLPDKLNLIFEVAISEIYQLKMDENLKKSLKQMPNIDNAINNPNATRLNLSGPRFGITAFTGKTAQILQQNKTQGGFDLSYPAMFQFGYQFEMQYLNEGNVQGLFEIIPMFSGMDQGKLIPSLTLLHGIRSNKQGWEFAFGPTLTLSNIADGYYDENGKWKLKKEWTDSTANPFPIITRMDSRGDNQFVPGFVIACGRSFKSGRLNIPVNAYLIPSINGIRIGASFGFNSKKD